jgi:hypothetical protein
MVKTGFKSVDEYFAAQPAAVQGILGRCAEQTPKIQRPQTTTRYPGICPTVPISIAT